MGWACSTYRERIDANRVLTGKPEGNRPLRRPRRRWGIILRWIFRKFHGVDWIDLAQHRDRRRAVIIAVLNLQIP